MLQLFKKTPPGLFAYFDGQRQQQVDPLDVIQRLAECPAYRPSMIDAAFAGCPVSLVTLFEVAGHAFGVRPLDHAGHGLSTLECVSLIHQFDRFMAAVKHSNAGTER